VAGLVTLYFGFTVAAVALFAIGIFFGRGASRYDLMVDLMKEHYYLAMFIADQREDDLSQLREAKHKDDKP